MEFKVLTEAEIKELSWRGRALLKSQNWGETRSFSAMCIGQVRIEEFLDDDSWNSWISPEDKPRGYCMGIYWVNGSRISDCHVENQAGHLIEEGEEFAARRALKVLRAHMVLDDLADI